MVSNSLNVRIAIEQLTHIIRCFYAVAEPKERIADLKAIFPFRKSIHPNHFAQVLLQKEHPKAKNSLKYRRIQDNFTFPETTNSRSIRIGSYLPQNDQGGPVNPSPKRSTLNPDKILVVAGG